MDKDRLLVDPSAARAVILTGLRYAAVLTAGFASLIGMIGRRDLEALIAFWQSAEGLTFLTTLITVASAGWGLWTRYRAHRLLARVADPRDPAYAELRR